MDEQNKKIGAGVGVMILKDNKILLGKRHSDPKKASSALHGQGTWTMPGGKLHFGETFEQVAKREVLEETGMKVNKIKVISLSNNIIPEAHFITIGFLCEDFSGQPEVKEPDEITEWKWFELDNLPKPIFFPSQQVLDNYLSNKFYAG